MSRESVALEAATLKVHESRYLDCSFCGRANKMGITRTPEGVLYNCFSSGCGASGFIPDFSNPVRSKPLKDREERRYIGKVRHLKQEDFDYFRVRFGIDQDLASKYIRVTDNGEYLFPIFDHMIQRVGEVVRQPAWKGDPEPPRKGKQLPGYPKAKTYLANGATKLAWYWGERESTALVVVEDQVSALKCLQHAEVNAAALLGNQWTGLPTSALKLLDRVILWLDPDCHDKAFTIAQEHGAALPNFRVVMSEQDPKDSSPEEIVESLHD